jgi:hypothetical protein
MTNFVIEALPARGPGDHGVTVIIRAAAPMEVNVDADLMQRQAIGWVVVIDEEEDWSGVYDCGAIFMSSEPVYWPGQRDDWPLEQCS